MEINPATCFLGTFFRVRGILGKKACILEAVELASWRNPCIRNLVPGGCRHAHGTFGRAIFGGARGCLFTDGAQSTVQWAGSLGDSIPETKSLHLKHRGFRSDDEFPFLG